MTARRVAAFTVLFAFVFIAICLAVKSAEWAFAADTSKKDEKKAPPIKEPVMFNTPEANQILARMQVFPKDNPWNWDISYYPVAPNSKKMIEACGADGTVRGCYDMCFIIVPPDQKKVPVAITDYARESDPGPYPVPGNLPIQGWPISGESLDQIQQQGAGDRHAIIVDPWNGKLYEFYEARRTGGGWTAKQASIFDLTSNELRRDGWTSADAAGLPIFPGVVRYDECESGMVRHAIRVTMDRTRAAHVFPARHHASASKDPDLPRMGERLRLRADFDISKFSKHAQAVLLGMKVYGLIVADNGRSWDISLTPDKRLQGMRELSRLKGSDFEVVDAAAWIPPAKKRDPEKGGDKPSVNPPPGYGPGEHP